jgi:prepilin-type N-terminal cleavage/methylation domain-containing protein
MAHCKLFHCLYLVTAGRGSVSSLRLHRTRRQEPKAKRGKASTISAGFTLVEVLMTVVIVAVAAIAAVVSTNLAVKLSNK